MAIQTTYTQASDGLAELLDKVTRDREIVIIPRRGEEEVAVSTCYRHGTAARLLRQAGIPCDSR